MKTTIITLASFFLFVSMIFAQDFTQLLEQKLESHKKTTPRELVYIHTDKEVYTPGEAAFFKAYIHDYYSATSSVLKGRLFVLLIDFYGNSIGQSGFSIDGGKASGNIPLPADIDDGIYTLIGLTGLMQQGKPEHVFTKDLFIKKSFVPSTFIMLSTSEDIRAPMDETRVNVRLYNLNGKPYDEAYIYNVILNGEVIHSGTDEADKSGRSTIRFDLPEYDDGSVVWVEVMVDQGAGIDKNSIQIPTKGFPIKVSFFPESGSLIHGLRTEVGFTAFNYFDEPIQVEGSIVDGKGTVIGTISSLTEGLGRFTITPDKANPLKLQVTKSIGITETFDLPKITESGIQLRFMAETGSELQFAIHSNLPEGTDDMHAIAELDGKIIWSTELNPVGGNTFNIPTSGLNFGVIRVALLNKKGQLQAQRAVFISKSDPEIAIKPGKSRYELKDDPNLQVVHQNNPEEQFECSISITDSRLNPNWNNAQDIFSFFTLGQSIDKFDFHPGYFTNPDDEAQKIIDGLMLTLDEAKFDWPQLYSEEKIQMKPALPAEFMSKVMEDLRSSDSERYLAQIENDQFIYKYVLSQDRGIPGYFWENRKELEANGKQRIPSRQERITNLLRGGTPVLDVLKQIKHYSLTNNKIIFGGPNSLVNQDGALIVVDGIKMGTEASILNTLNPMDIQDIEVFTDPSSMARWTSLNGVGVINITTFGKDPQKQAIAQAVMEQEEEDDKAILLWDPLLEIEPNETLEISLEKMAMKTDYHVVIQGTDNKGRPIFSSSQFSVQ